MEVAGKKDDAAFDPDEIREQGIGIAPRREDFFGLICFLVLMQKEPGIIGKAPGYIGEKLWMTGAPPRIAYYCLDDERRAEVRKYIRYWAREESALMLSMGVPTSVQEEIRNESIKEAEKKSREGHQEGQDQPSKKS